MDEALAARKQPRKVIVSPPSTVEADEELLVVSFDGSASVKRNIGAFSAVIWKLPEWSIITAASGYLPEITVNEAEYQGLLLGLDLLPTLDRGWIVICGDSNLIIRQMRGEIDCRAPKLQLLRLKALDRLKSWPKHDLLHVKREWNQSADKLANAALKEEAGTSVTSEADRQDLITLNRLDEILQPKIEAPVCMPIATRAASRRRRVRPETLQESVVQRVRIRRVLQAQDEEQWIVHLKAYLQGDVTSLSAEEAKSCAKIAAEYDLDESGLLLYCSTGTKLDVDRDSIVRVVVPETLQQDFLHHYHASLEGGHQGIGRTFARIRKHFHWRGLFRSVQKYVGECVDCETGKGRPLLQGESPGNIQATYPFHFVLLVRYIVLLSPLLELNSNHHSRLAFTSCLVFFIFPLLSVPFPPLAPSTAPHRPHPFRHPLLQGVLRRFRRELHHHTFATIHCLVDQPVSHFVVLSVVMRPAFDSAYIREPHRCLIPILQPLGFRWRPGAQYPQNHRAVSHHVYLSPAFHRRMCQ
jgi:ribonuclease HI